MYNDKVRSWPWGFRESAQAHNTHLPFDGNFTCITLTITGSASYQGMVTNEFLLFMSQQSESESFCNVSVIAVLESESSHLGLSFCVDLCLGVGLIISQWSEADDTTNKNLWDGNRDQTCATFSISQSFETLS